jgi:hypothetical protein
VLGEKISLIPTASPSAELINKLRSRGEAFSLVLPSLEYDIFVEGFGRGAEPLENNIASAYSAAAFLSAVRGIPFEELSVGSHEGEYKILRDGEGYNLRLELCMKVARSGALSLPLMGAEIEYRISECKYGRIALVGCRDIRCFEPDVLKLVTIGANARGGIRHGGAVDGSDFYRNGTIRNADEPPGAELPFGELPVCGALVYGRCGGEITARSYFPKDGLDFRLAALGGLSAIMTGASYATLDCSGELYELKRRDGRLLLSLSVDFLGKEEI